MTTAVVSGRVDEAVRQRADVVMRKAGLKPTDVIQRVWTFMAQAGEIPDVAQPANAGNAKQDALARLDGFLAGLPPANPAYANWSDDDILALKTHDYG